MANSQQSKGEKIAFIDLKAQQKLLRDKINTAVGRVLDHGNYIMGAEVSQLETKLATFSGAKHVISCSSGTDGLLMSLMAKGIGPGHAVICPAFTFTATPEVIALLGATPVFADVDEVTFNLDAATICKALDAASRARLEPKAIIAVDLFGLPADYDAINAIAEEYGLWILADAAQSFGGSRKGRQVGTLGLATATSFFPAKPLGCYGDGGAIFTDNPEIAGILESIRTHGKGTDKYDNIRVGINGRLDTIQAAILIEKLALFSIEIEKRQAVAARYSHLLNDLNGIDVPQNPDGYQSVWAQYTLRVRGGKRDALAKALNAAEIPTAVYYPKPLHHQTAYKSFPAAVDGLPRSEQLSREVLSLPMHPYLTAGAQDRVVTAIRRAL